MLELTFLDLVVLLLALVEVVTGFEVGGDLSRLASGNRWPGFDDILGELNLLELGLLDLIVLLFTLVKIIASLKICRDLSSFASSYRWP